MSNDKICIIGERPNFNAEHFYARAFERLGWAVSNVVLDGSGLQRILITRSVTARRLHLRSNGLSVLQESKPDLIMVIKGAFLSDQNLDALSRLNTPLILYYTDTTRFPVLLRNRLDKFDFVFSAIPDGKMYKDFGARKFAQILWACDPEIHKPSATKERIVDVSFIGTFYWRRYWLMRSMSIKPKLAGNYWFLPPLVAESGPLRGPDYVRFVADSKVNINIHGRVDITSRALNMRVFEVAGIGSFLLTDGHADDVFPKRSIGIFNRKEELSEFTQYFLENEQIREEYALKALEVCHKEHTYDNRALSILKFMNL